MAWHHPMVTNRRAPREWVLVVDRVRRYAAIIRWRMPRSAVAALCLAVLLPAAAAAGAQERRVEVTPFAGLQFGGAVQGIEGGEFSVGASLDYGVTLDVPFGESWRVEALYSRDETRLAGPGPSVGITVERYLAGLVEEHHYGRTRFFGVGLVGATRWVPPAGYGSSTRFTLALGLGVHHRLSERFGIRAEARGFYTSTSSSGGLFCSGSGCLFVYGSSGLAQGDLSAGVSVAF
jgi:hypothetical protein